MRANTLDEPAAIADGLPIASLRGLTVALPISAALWASIIATAGLFFG